MADISKRIHIGGGGSTKILAPLIVLAVIVALSGVEYAHAQNELYTGSPLFMKLVEPVTAPCVMNGTGTINISVDRLSTSFTFDDKPTFIMIAYIEVNAKSTGKSIAVYNYTVHDNTMLSVTVPIDALHTITDDVDKEKFTTRPISSTIPIRIFDRLSETAKFIDHNDIHIRDYVTFPSAKDNGDDEFVLIVRNGKDKIINIIDPDDTKLVKKSKRNGDPTTCSAGSISPPTIDPFPEKRIIVKGEYAPLKDLTCTDSAKITGSAKIVPPLPNGDKLGDFVEMYRCEGELAMIPVHGKIVSAATKGGNADWQLNPTFGRSWENNAQIVSGGFTFNGVPTDVTDNFHTAFERTTAEIGKLNTIKAKIYTEMVLDQVTLSLGVPEPSRVYDAEAEITIKLLPDYSLPDVYEIVDIIHEQKEGLVDVSGTSSSVQKVQCMSDSKRDCYEIAITFRITAPLIHDVVAVSAMDIDRRITTTYINDGIGFEGEPLLPLLTHTMYSKKGNQHPVEATHLTQPDRRYNVWNDQHGFVWMKNSYGSWFQLTHAGFERLQDPDVNVMTRTHSNFADLVEQEKERARQVFDSESIKSKVGESFSHDAPVRLDKLDDPKILEKLKIAELAALEYLKRY